MVGRLTATCRGAAGVLSAAWWPERLRAGRTVRVPTGALSAHAGEVAAPHPAKVMNTAAAYRPGKTEFKAPSSWGCARTSSVGGRAQMRSGQSYLIRAAACRNFRQEIGGS